jgi:hypothetical protein
MPPVNLRNLKESLGFAVSGGATGQLLAAIPVQQLMQRGSTRWLLGRGSPLAVPVVLLVIASAACGGTSNQPPSGGGSTGPPNFVPWLALDPKHLVPTLPEPTPPVPVPAGTPICRASQLEGAARGPYAAAGNVNFPVVLRNRDTSSCYLDGYADVTVLGVGGAPLAQVGGTTGQGTFFDDGTVVQVLMDSGTPPLAAQPPVTAFSPARGQAFMDLTWDDCNHAGKRQSWLRLGRHDHHFTGSRTDNAGRRPDAYPQLAGCNAIPLCACHG